MTSLRGEPAPSASEPVSRYSASDSSPVEHRWRPWLVAALVAAALLIAGGVWWLLHSTVPVGDYDAVVAELEATKGQLANTQEALLAEQSRFQQADPAALLLGYFAGADPSIVTGQGWDRSWAGVVARDVAVDAIDDPVLTELYWEHIGGDVGDPVDEVAANEFMLRLVELTIEPILRSR